jgi:CRP/FNR family transcriptional regulator/CRP/FNR family cyclic AMP-dependent transcriptional regulator
VRAQVLFRDVPLFKAVPSHHLRQLARLAHRRRFSVGEVIIRMGELGTTMYVIHSGRVEVVRARPSGNVILATLGPGEFFGELAIFDGEPRSATVVAVEETEAVSLDHLDIVRAVNHSPELALSLLKGLCARVRAANQRADGPPAG